MDAEATARAFGLPGNHAGSNTRKRAPCTRQAREEKKVEKERGAKRCFLIWTGLQLHSWSRALSERTLMVPR